MPESVTIILKGTSYYQDVIAGLLDGAAGVLVPEPENSYDTNACAVLSNGHKVGYLPKGWTRFSWGSQVIRHLKDGEGIIKLYRVGGHQLSNGARAYFGLRLVLIFQTVPGPGPTHQSTGYFGPERR